MLPYRDGWAAEIWMIKAGFVGAMELAAAAAPTKEVRMRKAPNEPSARGKKRPGMAGEATDRQIEGAASAETAPVSSVRIDSSVVGSRTTSKQQQ
jgi:hypothetical protein